jgi:hypothetical protein
LNIFDRLVDSTSSYFICIEWWNGSWFRSLYLYFIPLMNWWINWEKISTIYRPLLSWWKIWASNKWTSNKWESRNQQHFFFFLSFESLWPAAVKFTLLFAIGLLFDDSLAFNFAVRVYYLLFLFPPETA